MPEDALRRTRDYLDPELAQVGVGIDLDLAGAAFLERNNKILDQFFQSIEADGAPIGMSTSAQGALKDLGHEAYISRRNGTRADLYRHTTSPVSPEEDSYQFASPVIAAAGPMLSGGAGVHAAPLKNPLEKPTLRLVAVPNLGFPAGPYLMKICGAQRAGGPLTLATEEISFDVTGTGKSIEWFLLPDLEGAVEQAVFITEPVGVGGTPDPSTFHEQGRALSTRRSSVLDGPYNYAGRALPNKNETKIGRSRKPRFRRDFDLRGGQVHDLQAIDALRLFAVECTPGGGMALPSPHSDKKDFNEKKRHALVLQLEKSHPSTTGVKWFCYLDDGPDPTLYQLIMGRRGNKAAPIGLDKKPLLYGYVAGETGESGGGNVPENLPWVLVSGGELPQEDTTGIEDPQGAPDTPRVFGQSRPEPGDYLATYSRKFQGPYGYGILESVAAPPAKITVPGDPSGVPTHIPEIVFPSRVNRLPNATFSKVGADGRPLEWEFDLTSSTLDLRVAGVLGMRTNGQLTTGTQPWVRSKPIPVVSDRVETVIGRLGVTDKAAGIARVHVRFYSDEAGASELDTATRITLASLGTTEGSSARAYFKKKIGPLADGGEVDWPADAVTFRLWGFAQNGATSGARNLRITLDSLVWHPFAGELRRYPQSSAGELVLSEPAPGLPPAHIPSLDPATPVNSSHVVAVGPPPESPADVAASTPPYDIADLESGAFPTGWTIIRSVANADTEARVIAAAAIEGAFGFRVRSDHTTAKNACYAERNYPATLVNGSTIAERFLLRLLRRHASDNWLTVASVMDQNAVAMARLRLHGDGRLVLEALDASGSKVLASTTAATGLVNGDILDFEIIIGGGNTNSGAVSGGIADFGEARKATATLSGLDFSGRTPRRTRVGAFDETDARMKWTLDFDTVVVTPAGFVIESPTLPAFSDIPEPDRAKKAGVVFYSAEAPIAQTITTDPREQLGVSAHFASTATPPVDEVLMEIRDSAGTLLAHAVRRASPAGQVDVVKGSTVAPVASGLTGTATFSLDVIVRGAGSRSGTLVCYFTGADGVRRLRAQVPNLNWEGLYAQRALVLAGSHTVSQVRVTERGLKEYRDLAPTNSLPINQSYTGVVPADATGGDTGLIVDEDFVMPGVERTCAAFIRHQDADLALPPKPLTVVVYNEAGEELVMGNIYGGAGANAPGVSTREEGWSETDRFFHYTPPPGYYRRRIENREMYSGAFVYQELLDARGHLDTLSLRDAKRNELRAASGTLRRILSGRVRDRGHRSPDYEEERLRLVAEVDVPDGTLASARFRATDEEAPTIASPSSIWTPSGWTSDPSAAPDLAFANVEVTLTGDPLDLTKTPTVPSGGVALEYRTEQAFLTREDGSPLPGGAHVWLPHGVRPHRLPNYRNARPGGASRPTPITGRLGKFGEVLVYVFTPEAFAELVENQLTDSVTEAPVFWRIEAPDFNEVMRVRLYDVAETEVIDADGMLPESMIGYQWVALRASEVEVLESGPLGIPGL